ncbi:SDR family NAD(P)-dependent oxidoreductase [Deinococcus sp. KNUC1210]|uniref:SDR family NAD(P)-dependent oxidoreductase n=1 Tax=Deinococcus sp. KNUC1210 TaxID=2917691 RepID=UPI001EEFCC7B|nr:SDR family NAD(P)-dependent oxidoreductase [Deinococcus sp. KNUC1210]ULH14950.1 SDR family NAD(P)-dependent oxidoreductase [Deinococcus sp. KNUC1210]
MATLVFGATGGIGSAVARGWKDDRLWLSGRDEPKLSALATELGATPLRADLGYESHIKTLFAGLDTPLDTLVYAAGSAYPEALNAATPDAVRRVWNANYFGAMWVLKYGLPALSADGRMYFIGARPELVTVRGFSQYAASKAALSRLLEIARIEARGKTLTLVLPPAVETPLWEQVGRTPKGAMSAGAVAGAIIADRAGDGQAELRVDSEPNP